MRSASSRQAIRMIKANELQVLANADFKALAEIGIRLYRATLLTNEQDRKEFDMAWGGLNHCTGCFEGLEEDEQKTMRLIMYSHHCCLEA